MSRGGTQGYSVIPAGSGVDEYKSAIIGLWKNNIPDVPPGRFSWLYSDNPAGPARSWLAVSGSGRELVGIGSLYPRRMLVNGRQLTAGVAVDFAIDKKHRVLGPALMIQRAILSSGGEHGFPFVYSYPNVHSHPIIRHVGYRFLGKVCHCVKPLRIEKRISAYVKIGILAKCAAFAAERYFRVMDRLRAARVRFDLAARVLTRCDERFDALWEELKPRYPVTGEKTSAFLNWRYVEDPEQPFLFFCLFTPDLKRLKGFIAYTVKNDTAVIMDLLVDGSGRLCDHLFLAFSERMRRENISLVSLTFFGNERFAGRARSLGFFALKTERSFFIFSSRLCDLGTAATIFNKENWLLFKGDMDL